MPKPIPIGVRSQIFQWAVIQKMPAADIHLLMTYPVSLAYLQELCYKLVHNSEFAGQYILGHRKALGKPKTSSEETDHLLYLQERNPTLSMKALHTL